MEFALAALIELQKAFPNSEDNAGVIECAGTDGTDGPTDAPWL